MKILLIEDDHIIARNLQILLRKHGYVIDYRKNGKDGLKAACVNEYDVVLLDWMLPDINGDKVCEKIRSNNIDVPIIFLTANNQIEDKVSGLNLGADDYITKPFVIEEVLARIRALIRRNYNKNLQSIIKIGAIRIYTDKCEVHIDNKSIKLSPKQYSILEYLANNLDKVVSRSDIIEHIWDEHADIFSNVVDVHIKNLRNLFIKNGIKDVIKTIKGKGYMLCSK